MAQRRDYYEVLGIPRDADDGEIKRAYREQARQHHPDINPDSASSEDRFKEINEAYAVLSDPRTRSRYDRYGFAAVGGAARSEPQSGFGAVVDAVDEILGDIWRRRRQRQRGRDLRYTLEVSFEEAAFGCEKTIQIPTTRLPEPGAATRSFKVTVPPGTKPGAVKMIKGEGEPGTAGGPPGDLHVIVRVREHSVFRREGHDVWCDVPVSFTQAALGSAVEVPTLDGKVRMRIPEGTQSGRVFRLRERGIPRSASRSALRGDQMVRVVVETPTGLTDRQRALLEQFAQESGDEIAHPQKKSFLEKLRALFED
ncbi:DnaJ C-terminal domain-containing protein [Haliangium sp.]|uniref:DnaJ C-terminal domain-containing protein n=1 Tax=Haliangium sp. TaxID=2663208 RepID=UPI003D09EFEA